MTRCTGAPGAAKPITGGVVGYAQGAIIAEQTVTARDGALVSHPPRFTRDIAPRAVAIDSGLNSVHIGRNCAACRTDVQDGRADAKTSSAASASRPHRLLSRTYGSRFGWPALCSSTSQPENIQEGGAMKTQQSTRLIRNTLPRARRRVQNNSPGPRGRRVLAKAQKGRQTRSLPDQGPHHRSGRGLLAQRAFVVARITMTKAQANAGSPSFTHRKTALSFKRPCRRAVSWIGESVHPLQEHRL